MLFSSGASDMIVTLMACNRLFSIWSISIYDKRNNQLVSFKRRSTKKKSVPFKVLLQVVSAFILSFSFHIPFFIDTSDDPMQCGYCNFHQHSPKGNLSVYKLTINLCKNNISKIFYKTMFLFIWFGNIQGTLLLLHSDRRWYWTIISVTKGVEYIYRPMYPVWNTFPRSW